MMRPHCIFPKMSIRKQTQIRRNSNELNKKHPEFDPLIDFTKNGWQTDNTFIGLIDEILVQDARSNLREKTNKHGSHLAGHFLVFMDSASMHRSVKVLKHFDTKTKPRGIPVFFKTCTTHVSSPCDLNENGRLQNLCDDYIKHLSNDDEDDHIMLLKAVCHAYVEVYKDKNVFKGSFKDAGIFPFNPYIDRSRLLFSQENGSYSNRKKENVEDPFKESCAAGANNWRNFQKCAIKRLIQDELSYTAHILIRYFLSHRLIKYSTDPWLSHDKDRYQTMAVMMNALTYPAHPLPIPEKKVIKKSKRKEKTSGVLARLSSEEYDGDTENESGEDPLETSMKLTKKRPKQRSIGFSSQDDDLIANSGLKEVKIPLKKKKISNEFTVETESNEKGHVETKNNEKGRNKLKNSKTKTETKTTKSIKQKSFLMYDGEKFPEREILCGIDNNLVSKIDYMSLFENQWFTSDIILFYTAYLVKNLTSEQSAVFILKKLFSVPVTPQKLPTFAELNSDSNKGKNFFNQNENNTIFYFFSSIFFKILNRHEDRINFFLDFLDNERFVIIPIHELNHYFVIVTKKTTTGASVYVLDSMRNDVKGFRPSVTALSKLIGRLHELKVEKTRVEVSEQSSGNCGPNSLSNIEQLIEKLTDRNQKVDEIVFDHVYGLEMREKLQRILTRQTRTYVVPSRKIHKVDSKTISKTEIDLTNTQHIRSSCRSNKGIGPEQYSPPN
jgi:hypothetical protein